MNRTRFAAGLLVLLAVAPLARSENPLARSENPPGAIAIAGDWTVKRFADGSAGKPIEVADFKELTVTGDKLFIHYVQNEREKAAVMRYSLGERIEGAGRAIDIRHRKDGKESVYLGICRREGSDMAICVSIEPGVRVTDFAAGEKRIFIVASAESK